MTPEEREHYDQMAKLGEAFVERVLPDWQVHGYTRDVITFHTGIPRRPLASMTAAQVERILGLIPSNEKGT